jgi:hypothetical protein
MLFQVSGRKSPFIPRPLESLKPQMNENNHSAVTEEVSSGVERFVDIPGGRTPMGPTMLLTDTIFVPPQLSAHPAEKVLALALGLAHAENELRAFTSDQVDAIVDLDGRPYLLRSAQELEFGL